MKAETRLCKDCKWVRNPGEFAKCAHPKSYRNKEKAGAGLRTGFGAEEANDFCSLSRGEGYIGSWILNYCGVRGRWFERATKGGR